MGEIIQIGPLAISVGSIPLLSGVIGAIVCAYVLLKSRPSTRRRVFDVLIGAFLFAFLGFRLGPVLREPAFFLERPATILWAPGGTLGGVLAVASGLLYIGLRLFASKRVSAPLLRPVGASLATGVAAGALAFGIIALLGSGSSFSGQSLSSAGGRVGAHAPAFDLPTLSGSRLGLPRESGDSGEVIVLNFWASWCTPCRAEMPELIRFTETAPANVHLWAINLTSTEDGRSEIAGFVEDFGMQFPVLLDERGSVAAAYDVRSVPTTVVVASDGRVRARKSGVASRDWIEAQTGPRE
jgi:thiol-disulfide isomerase/thioredoxin